MRTEVKRLMVGVVMVGSAVGAYSSLGPALGPQEVLASSCDGWCMALCDSISTKNYQYNCYTCDANHCSCYVSGC
jgi:hypothetical protein